jgi:regulator of protease activity HflC (stomatin/prohibitin superfamily)
VDIAIALLIIVVIVAIVARLLISVVLVRDYQRGLRVRSGRLVGLVGPGLHVTLSPFTEIQVLDGRPTLITVPGQEILTADGVALKISLSARYVIADPVTAVTADQSYVTALYAGLHAGLRDAVAGRTTDDILADRATLGPAVAASVASEVARLGLELLAVDVRDVMVPGELKRAFAGIVAARRDGEAALERARGETAALRSLANGGRLLDEHPGLFRLRLLQQVGGTSGNTIVLDVDGSAGRTDGSRPLPIGAPPIPRNPDRRGRGGSGGGAAD